LANYQAEINSGNPVLLNLAGHSIVGYGFSGSTIYIRDTWDNEPSHVYTMTWGTSYSGMELVSSSVVHLAPLAYTQQVYLPIVLYNPNNPPTNIRLSNDMIREKQPVNTVIGSFSTVDPDAGDTFTYQLVDGAGSTDNSSFNISSNKLRSSKVFDYATQNSFSILVRTTDQGGLSFDKVFIIKILPLHYFLNWNFELGPTDWQEYSSNGYALIVQPPSEVFTAFDGSWAAWLGGVLNETSYIQQQVLIPKAQPYLSYRHWIASLDTCGHDFAKVYVNGKLVQTYDLCIGTETYGWVKHVVDLRAYAGKSATVQIRAECDGENNSNLFIDQVTLQSSATSGDLPLTQLTGSDARTPKPDFLAK